MIDLQDLMNKVEEIKRISKENNEKENEVHELEVKMFSRIVGKLKPIIEFVDNDIEISIKGAPCESDLDHYESSYYNEPGIPLIEWFDKEYYDERKESWDFTGYNIYLTRSGEIIKVTREGKGFRDREYGVDSWNSEVEDISSDELLKEESFEYILHNIVHAFENRSESQQSSTTKIKQKFDLINKMKNVLG